MYKFSLNILLIITTSLNAQTIDIINPANDIGIKNWYLVNDDVMGGVSKSSIELNNQNKLVFKGFLSLENNGGFASTRLALNKGKLKEVKAFKIKFKGDGNSYKLRLRQNNRRAVYSSKFITNPKKWLEVKIPVEEFKPTWRGFSYTNYPKVDTEKIITLGLQISDKQEGNFKLEIEYIKAVF